MLQKRFDAAVIFRILAHGTHQLGGSLLDFCPGGLAGIGLFGQRPHQLLLVGKVVIVDVRDTAGPRSRLVNKAHSNTPISHPCSGL